MVKYLRQDIGNGAEGGIRTHTGLLPTDFKNVGDDITRLISETVQMVQAVWIRRRRFLHWWLPFILAAVSISDRGSNGSAYESKAVPQNIPQLNANQALHARYVCMHVDFS